MAEMCAGAASVSGAVLIAVYKVVARAQSESSRSASLHLRRAAYALTARGEAEMALVAFTQMNGGEISTDMLAPLYEEKPWLRHAVGSLKDF